MTDENKCPYCGQLGEWQQDRYTDGSYARSESLHFSCVCPTHEMVVVRKDKLNIILRRVGGGLCDRCPVLGACGAVHGDGLIDGENSEIYRHKDECLEKLRAYLQGKED